MLVVDTSVLVGHLRDEKRATELLRREIRRGDVMVPTLVEWELLRGATGASAQSVVRALLDNFEPALLTPAIAQTAARLHNELASSGRPLASIDLLIAAHALHHNCPIASFDKAFQEVLGLEVMSR